MAISLKDVKNRKKGKKGDNKLLKDKVLRPWQGYEELGSQTRTVAAEKQLRALNSQCKKIMFGWII